MSFTNAEVGLQFVDSNVLVYAHDDTAGAKFVRAQALLADLWRSGRGRLSIQVLQEFFVTTTRKVRRPVESEAAEKAVSYLGRWTLHRPDVKDVLAAIDGHRRHRISFWDAMILHSAAELGCSVIWSEDLGDGQTYDGVRVVNPFADTPRP
jgi:predicted nucleic acid-binding protein